MSLSKLPRLTIQEGRLSGPDSGNFESDGAVQGVERSQMCMSGTCKRGCCGNPQTWKRQRQAQEMPQAFASLEPMGQATGLDSEDAAAGNGSLVDSGYNSNGDVTLQIHSEFSEETHGMKVKAYSKFEDAKDPLENMAKEILRQNQCANESFDLYLCEENEYPVLLSAMLGSKIGKDRMILIKLLS